MTAVIPQHLAALELANQRLRGQAALRRQIRRRSCRDGRLMVADLLDAPARECNMRIGQLLLAIRTTGPKTLRRWLNKAEVFSEDRRLLDLSERQRAVLTSLLREA